MSGVFETMRTYGRDIFMLDAHLRRLEHSADLVSMKLPESRSTIREKIIAAQQSFVGPYPLVVRVIATNDTVKITVDSLSVDPNVANGVAVTMVNLEREFPQEAKQWPYTQCQRVHQQAVDKGFFESLLVDSSGIVREGAYSNIFWVKGGRLFTIEDRILKGITRQVVMDQLPAEMSNITTDALLECEEVFITKTTTGVTGITSIDGHAIGGRRVGAITKSLMEYFRNLCSSSKIS